MNMQQQTSKASSKSSLKRVLGIIGRVMLYPLTFILILLITVYLALTIICRTSDAAKSTFVTTVLETGQMKFLASLCLSDEEIQAVIDTNSMKAMNDASVDEGLIVLDAFADDKQSVDIEGVVFGEKDKEAQDIEIVEIAGLTYKATLMIVKDPSRVNLATIINPDGTWPEKGITLKEIVSANKALGGINGGLYASNNNTGGHPYGVVVSNGEIVRNKPKEFGGLVLVGLTDRHILQIIDINGMSASDVEKMIKEKGIRDAVCFQEHLSTDNNHFVQLVINNVPRTFTGSGSGLNPRTAIGQRADGALLLLVTDGRGYRGHAGASAADLIDIMVRYGAINAANLDGGSSTCMYYDGDYLQDSVTFYYSQSSWRMPFAFLIH